MNSTLTLLTVEVLHLSEVFTASVCVEHHSEEDYGADADGRRGSFKTFIDDVEILEIHASLGEKITTASKLLEDKICESAETLLN